MTSRDSQPLLSENRFGLKFLVPETELAFRRWRNDQILPLLAVAAGAGLVLYVLGVLGFAAHFGLDFASARWWWLLFGAVIPSQIFCILVGLTRLRRWAVLWASLFIAITGSIGTLFGPLLEMKSVGGAFGLAMAFALCLPFLRVPPLWAMAVVSALMLPLALVSLTPDYADRVTFNDATIYLLVVVSAYFVTAASSIATERLLRRSYAKERIVEQSRNLIRRYIPPAVADQIIAGHESRVDTPRRLRVTILFSDMVDFTSTADRLDAESLTQILNEYMAAMADIVEAHGGTLNEFAGDGLMAVFGAPNEMAPEAQVLQAVAAAQKMQALMPSLNEQWRKLGIGEALQIRVGVNTGVLSVGSFGSEGRMTYTAVGLQTNIASRIETAAEPGEILISDASYQLIRDSIDCEPRGEVECKGVHFPVKVYSPICRP